MSSDGAIPLITDDLVINRVYAVDDLNNPQDPNQVLVTQIGGLMTYQSYTDDIVNWSNYPAVSNVDISGYNIIGVNSILGSSINLFSNNTLQYVPNADTHSGLTVSSSQSGDDIKLSMGIYNNGTNVYPSLQSYSATTLTSQSLYLNPSGGNLFIGQNNPNIYNTIQGGTINIGRTYFDETPTETKDIVLEAINRIDINTVSTSSGSKININTATNGFVNICSENNGTVGIGSAGSSNTHTVNGNLNVNGYLTVDQGGPTSGNVYDTIYNIPVAIESGTLYDLSGALSPGLQSHTFIVGRSGMYCLQTHLVLGGGPVSVGDYLGWAILKSGYLVANSGNTIIGKDASGVDILYTINAPYNYVNLIELQAAQTYTLDIVIGTGWNTGNNGASGLNFQLIRMC
jgi:hypothetical protein